MRSQFDRKNFTPRQVKVESLRRYEESRAKQQRAVIGERTLTPWYDEKKSKKERSISTANHVRSVVRPSLLRSKTLLKFQERAGGWRFALDARSRDQPLRLGWKRHG
jgi:hypothetical protein